MKTQMKFRLIDCEIYDDTKYPGEIKSEISHSNLDEYLSENSDNGESTDSDSNPAPQPGKNKYVLQSKCVVQLFGKDKQGQSYCCYVQGFKPFFYLKVDDTLEQTHSFQICERNHRPSWHSDTDTLFLP
jgi:hypothetical protein